MSAMMCLGVAFLFACNGSSSQVESHVEKGAPEKETMKEDVQIAPSAGISLQSAVTAEHLREFQADLAKGAKLLVGSPKYGRIFVAGKNVPAEFHSMFSSY